MIVAAYLLIAQAAMVEPSRGIGPPFWIQPPHEVVLTIPYGVRSGLDVISVDGPGVTMFVDPQSDPEDSQ